MSAMRIDDVDVTITGFTDMTEDEVRRYVAHVKATVKHPLTELAISPGENDGVCLSYEEGLPKFERIRRITGYLVGTVDRWNDAKRAEEKERVKHTA